MRVMGTADLHILFNDDTNRLSVWNSAHQEILAVECRNRATGGEGFGHNGRCPRGVYELGEPVATHAAAFGWWFVPLIGEEKFDRAGIGIHGGGSGLWNSLRSGRGGCPLTAASAAPDAGRWMRWWD
jgi:hypothetical protein